MMLTFKGITVVLVTHEPAIAAHSRRIVHIQDGLIVCDEPVAEPRDAEAQRYPPNVEEWCKNIKLWQGTAFGGIVKPLSDLPDDIIRWEKASDRVVSRP